MEIGTIVTAVTAVISSVVASITAYFLYKTMNYQAQTVSFEAKGQQAQVFLEIVHLYNDIYDKRNELLRMDLSWDKFDAEHPTLDDKLTSQEWRTLRQVAACYELLGVLVKHEYLDRRVLFDTFFLNPRGALGKPEVSLWKHVSGLVDGMRRIYNPDQWINWQHLVEQEEEYLIKQKRSVIIEKSGMHS